MSFSFVAGNVLTATNLNNLAPQFVIKQAAQNVAASTTLVNDSELALTFPTTGITYKVDLYLSYFSATAAADIKVAWARTGTLTALMNRYISGPGPATVDTNAAVTTAGSGITKQSQGWALTTGVPYGVDGTNNAAAYESFIIRVDVAGTLTLQWAQNSASGTTTVNAGSLLIATPIAM